MQHYTSHTSQLCQVKSSIPLAVFRERQQNRDSVAVFEALSPAPVYG